MKPSRNPEYLRFVRRQPCCVCGKSWGVEASHTGPHGLGQKSPDESCIPLCGTHHRTGRDSYHVLGRVKFSEVHSLDIPAIIFRLTSVAHENERISAKAQGMSLRVCSRGMYTPTE